MDLCCRGCQDRYMSGFNCKNYRILMFFYVFFFFQAEDGIRDIGVTGVQTCALPICCGFHIMVIGICLVEVLLSTAPHIVRCVIGEGALDRKSVV